MDATLHMPSRFALYGVLLCDISHEYLVATYIARYVSYVSTLLPSKGFNPTRPYPMLIH